MIRGILPIVHTPFLDDATMDEASLAREVDWAFNQGADGYCTGMVSELLRLTYDERIRLTRLLGELKPRGKTFIAGVGAESTQQAIAYARHAEQAGADGVMAIPPVSTGLPDSQVLEYFSTLAEQISLPIVVQDASAYVGRPISMSVYLQLLDTFGPERILFKPEASPVGPNVSALRDASGGRARIFDGSGGIALVDCYRRGIAGTMPGLEFLPGIVALWRALERGDDEAVYRIYFPICALVTLQLQAGLDGFLATEKYLLHRQGLFTTPHRRKPYAWDLDPETQAELDRLVDRLQQSLTPSAE
jgi:2-keto-3-deoxy-L-arabinonate dehydratase